MRRTESGDLVISVTVGADDTATRRINRPTEKKTSRTPAILMGGGALVALIAMAAIAIVASGGSSTPNRPNPPANENNAVVKQNNEGEPTNTNSSGVDIVARDRMTSLIARMKRGEVRSDLALDDCVDDGAAALNADTAKLLTQELQTVANRQRAIADSLDPTATLAAFERVLASFCIRLLTASDALYEMAMPSLVAFSQHVVDPELSLVIADALAAVGTSEAALAVVAMRERFGLDDERWVTIAPGFKAAFAGVLDEAVLDPVAVRMRVLDELRTAVATLLEANDVDGALAEVDAALVDSPGDLDVMLVRAEIYMSREEFFEAGNVCQDVLDQHQDYAPALVLLGRMALAQNNPRQAIADLNVAIRENGTDARAIDAYLYRAIAYRAIRDYSPAIEDLTIYLDAKPNHHDARVLRARSYMGMDENEKALADLNLVIEADDQHADAYYRRGYVLYVLDQVQAAHDDFTSVIEIDPSHTRAMVNRGATRRTLGDPDGAMEDYDAAIELEPNDASARNNRGNLFLDLDQPDKALTDYEVALASDPDNALILTNSGDALAALDRNEEAVIQYTKALRGRANYSRALKGRGQVFLKLERWLEARTDLEVLAVAQTTDHEVWVALAHAHYNLDAIDRAQIAFEFALRNAPEEAQQDVLDARRALLGE